ncbi:RtcB family protein [Kamptonema cortianum]|jgi:tRNA-splicing ligase RtcB|nr:RtcB family protein [Geitlerinema splendidum]MDK3161403.1 RtcB family protein [Kamptonema cortianum]
MDMHLLEKISETEWKVSPKGKMRVPGIIFADERLIQEMDDKVYEQMTNVATLPGIVKASYVMPDGHWGYGFPIGGVAAFDPEEGGIISGGGVGFDISCGVRCLLSSLTKADLEEVKVSLAHELSRSIPAGVGRGGRIRMTFKDLDHVLLKGAKWAVQQGYGFKEDLERIEEGGSMEGANPEEVSDKAKKRQKPEMGTLGSGNHYLEVQELEQIYHPRIAEIMGLRVGQIVISIHCGSRGLGHQIGTEYLREMLEKAETYKIKLPDRELACAPILSPLGQRYLGAMRPGINCALANRQIITHLLRETWETFFPGSPLKLLYDVSHNTCKLEEYEGRKLYIHRKGATRAFGPGHPALPPALQEAGQPVFIGGSMGTNSYILAGMEGADKRSFNSSCHGAGRALSRHQAHRQWQGKELVQQLETRGILIRSPSFRGVAEEAPLAYKDVNAVVNVSQKAGLARKVARLSPLICIKG